MRHKYKGRKLGSDYSHTKAMKVGLVQALFLNDRIKTTETRAKEVRRDVDKVITWAKKGDLHSRRLAISALGNNSELAREVFEKVQQGMFEGRPGGYTRIMKLGPRKGDGAPMVIMEIVNETCVPKAEKKKAASKSASGKKATPSKKAKKEVAEAAEESHETVLEKIEDNIEAAEETFAENVREEGEKQLAEEKAEAAKEDAEEAEAKAADDAADAKEAAEEASEEAEAKKEDSE